MSWKPFRDQKTRAEWRERLLIEQQRRMRVGSRLSLNT
jgi:hypothetical protein